MNKAELVDVVSETGGLTQADIDRVFQYRGAPKMSGRPVAQKAPLVPAANIAPPQVNLEQRLSATQLKSILANRGFKGYSHLTRDQVIQELRKRTPITQKEFDDETLGNNVTKGKSPAAPEPMPTSVSNQVQRFDAEEMTHTTRGKTVQIIDPVIGTLVLKADNGYASDVGSMMPYVVTAVNRGRNKTTRDLPVSIEISKVTAYDGTTITYDPTQRITLKPYFNKYGDRWDTEPNHPLYDYRFNQYAQPYVGDMK